MTLQVAALENIAVAIIENAGWQNLFKKEHCEPNVPNREDDRMSL